MPEWKANLDGPSICGGDCAGDDAVVACLALPPDGLGVPPLRTEDQVYPQRDGVDQFSDWYEPRIVTLTATIGDNSCGCEGDARFNARYLMEAWSRKCDDTELVLFTDCSDPAQGSEVNGPFGVIGRPRAASLAWRRGKAKIADAILRFDARDHRLYLLDEDGTPGSGAVCASGGMSATSPAYDGGAGTGDVDHHWPLDFPHLTLQPFPFNPDINLAEDVIGSSDADLSAGYESIPTYDGTPEQVSPVSFALSLSAIEGPATLEILGANPGSYTSGMVGWWQTAGPAKPGIPGAVFRAQIAHFFGRDNTQALTPTISWGGAPVAMNSDLQQALGFTDDLRGLPVFVLLTWDASNLYVYTAYEGKTAPFLTQTVSAGSLPPSGAGPGLQLTALGGKISNVISGANHYASSADGEALAADIAGQGFAVPDSEVTIPDAGTLCSSFVATFASATDSAVRIFNPDGSYVGITAVPGYNPASSLDTSDGSATRLFGTQDATGQVEGNPFLEVSPGSVVHVFGNNAATICFRPSVISA